MPGPVPAAPFPPWAAAMAQRLRDHFSGTLATQCIVNEYRPGQGIGMHADRRDFGEVASPPYSTCGSAVGFANRVMRTSSTNSPGDRTAGPAP